MSGKLKTGILGRVSNIGHQLSSTGRTIETYATVEVTLGNIRDNDPLERNLKAEKQIEALKKQLLGNQVQMFIVASKRRKQ